MVYIIEESCCFFFFSSRAVMFTFTLLFLEHDTTANEIFTWCLKIFFLFRFHNSVFHVHSVFYFRLIWCCLSVRFVFFFISLRKKWIFGSWIGVFVVENKRVKFIWFNKIFVFLKCEFYNLNKMVIFKFCESKSVKITEICQLDVLNILTALITITALSIGSIYSFVYYKQRWIIFIFYFKKKNLLWFRAKAIFFYISVSEHFYHKST